LLCASINRVKAIGDDHEIIHHHQGLEDQETGTASGAQEAGTTYRRVRTAFGLAWLSRANALARLKISRLNVLRIVFKKNKKYEDLNCGVLCFFCGH
jgi:hypothetical protein